MGGGDGGELFICSANFPSFCDFFFLPKIRRQAPPLDPPLHLHNRLYLSHKNCLCRPGSKSYHFTLNFACCSQGVTLGAGLVITFASFVLVYFINKKADLIFTPGTDPLSSDLQG